MSIVLGVDKKFLTVCNIFIVVCADSFLDRDHYIYGTSCIRSVGKQNNDVSHNASIKKPRNYKAAAITAAL